ncbi:phenol hydroxylase subunit P4 [Xanthobacter agilis]|uniref:Phenol hydroxylase P4 protein n=1 Tax=Xanthobacter agilis TaxID=47492 RepID=A0ABU0LFB1_XANAG|nr:phenol hydroxylase subunit P4 [Xanthobacter agilis]MDQ0505826.1 phenol hydroxylase P4 protein [Xanthobacter agilis]
MSINAISPDYESHIVFRDAEQNFHGNRVIYVHWEQHLSFCSAIAFPLPPAMPFGAFVEEVIKPHYAAHPDAAHVDWSKLVWMIDGEKTAPDFSKSLAENGIQHKSLVRFWTPGLDGYKSSAS